MDTSVFYQLFTSPHLVLILRRTVEPNLPDLYFAQLTDTSSGQPVTSHWNLNYPPDELAEILVWAKSAFEALQRGESDLLPSP